MITLHDQEIIGDIVKRVVTACLSPAVLETKPEPAGDVLPPVSMTVGEILDMMRAYRATLKKHDKIMDQYRNHPFDSKNARRNIEAVRNELEKAEEDFIAFCKKVASGQITVNRVSEPSK